MKSSWGWAVSSVAATPAPATSDNQLVRRVLSRAARARPIPGNRVALLVDGPATFERMLGTIATAQRQIHLENYIIRHDATGWRFAEALAAAATRGVTVRVLYDWFGCLTTSRKLWRFLRRQGAEVRAFNRPKLLDAFANLTRDHRKNLSVDGTIGIVGGLCLGDEWAGDLQRGLPPWRDTAVLVEGPAVAALDGAFADIWHLAGGSVPPAGPEPAPRGDTMVHVIAGRPGRGRVYQVVDLLASGASDRLWITDAYLVTTRRILNALRNAARDGVDVRLLVPSTSDVPVVRNLTRIGYRELLRAGVRIFEWEGPMIHAKTQVSDGRWCRIGSSNLNAASLLGNYELDLLIDDQVLAAELEGQFRRDLARSAEIVLPESRLATLVREAPAGSEAEVPRSGLERRKRAFQALRTVATGARRSLFLPVSVTFVSLGALAIILPRVAGWMAAAGLLWLAIAAGLEGFRRRGV